MKKSVWKFEFEIDDEFTLEMPRYAEILHVQMQGKSPCIWALVNTSQPKVKRKFALRGTGHACDDLGNAEFVGTFFAVPDGSLVFHLFERGEYEWA